MNAIWKWRFSLAQVALVSFSLAAWATDPLYTNVTTTALPGVGTTDIVSMPMQPGGTVGDFNGDGLPDLFFLMGADGGPNQMFINSSPLDGPPAFTENATALQLDETYDGYSATAVDYDGDGDQDLFVTTINSGGARLYRNDDAVFTEVAAASGLSLDYNDPADVALSNTSATWGDYDRDGDLDVFVGSWLHSPNYSRNRLFQNQGNGTFLDVTVPAGLDHGKVPARVGKNGAFNCDNIDGDWYCWPRGFSPRFCDMNNDGWPDIALTADFNTSQLYLNSKDGSFSVHHDTAGIVDDDNGMGNAAGDFDNDGDLDWFIGCIDHQPIVDKGNALYLNDGTGVFANVALARGVLGSYFNWGATALDFDNDMDLDIYAVNGWSAEWEDQPAVLFENDGTTFFTDTAGDHNADVVSAGRGVGYLDIEGDGYLDIYITNLDGTPILLSNGGNGKNYLSIRFLDQFTKNKRQIGARVTVTAGGVSQYRELFCGSNYLSQDETFLHFGMASLATADQVHVILPDGRQMILTDVATNQMLEIDLPPKGSSDGDNDVDLRDYADFGNCFGGPVKNIACLTFEYDYDEDIDHNDYAEFLARMTGPRGSALLHVE